MCAAFAAYVAGCSSWRLRLVLSRRSRDECASSTRVFPPREAPSANERPYRDRESGKASLVRRPNSNSLLRATVLLRTGATSRCGSVRAVAVGLTVERHLGHVVGTDSSTHSTHVPLQLIHVLQSLGGPQRGDCGAAEGLDSPRRLTLVGSSSPYLPSSGARAVRQDSAWWCRNGLSP